MAITAPQQTKPTGIPFTHGLCEVCGQDAPVRTSPVGYPGTAVSGKGCGNFLYSKAVKRYKDRHVLSSAKDDHLDALAMAHRLRTDRHRFRPFRRGARRSHCITADKAAM